MLAFQRTAVGNQRRMLVFQRTAVGNQRRMLAFQRTAVGDQRRMLAFQRTAVGNQLGMLVFQRTAVGDQRLMLAFQRTAVGDQRGMLGFQSAQDFIGCGHAVDPVLELSLHHGGGFALGLQLRLQRGFACSQGRFQIRFQPGDAPGKIFVRRLRGRHRLLFVAQRMGKSRLGGIGALAGIDPCAERVEQTQHRHFGIGAGQRGEFAETLGRLRANQQHAQTVGVLELEAGITRAQLIPQFPHAEIALAHHGVVEQHHRMVRQFRQPRFEIVADRFVGVQTVDVQQIDRAVGEVGQRLVESHPQQLRKTAVVRVVFAQRLEHFIAVESGVLVALPGVHREAFRFQPAARHRLAEAEVGRAVMAAQFNQDPRARLLHRPERERQMADPCTGRHQPRRHRHAGIQRDVGNDLAHVPTCAPSARRASASEKR